MITPAILVASFVLTAAWTFAFWKIIPEAIRKSRTRTAMFVLIVTVFVAYGGTKPPGPDPDPDPHPDRPSGTNSLVIPAHHDGRPGPWRVQPSGTFSRRYE